MKQVFETECSGAIRVTPRKLRIS